MASSSSFIFGNRQQVDANLTVGTLSNPSIKQQKIGIFFHCSRLVSSIDQTMKTVFTNAIQGKAHLDMTPGNCPQHKDVAGECGNRRKHLTECRCEILDRNGHPEIRLAYEDKVIKAIFQLLRTQKKDSFHLKLAIFCPGFLLGEEILLFRLFEALKKGGFSGKIELFFVDRCFRNAIGNARNDGSFEDTVGKEKYIAQFIEEMCACLPKNITLEGTFFGDARHYIEMAKNNPHFKHHLLIGADIEKANLTMGEVGREAGLGTAAPITLIKRDATPQLCHLDLLGNLEGCRNPLENVQQESDNHEKLMYIVLGITAIALALLIIIKLRKTH